MATVNTSEWIGAGLGLLTSAVAAFYAFLRKVFVTNYRLEQIMERQEKRREEQRLELHRENLANFRTLFERLGKVEQSQARTEGLLSGRFPRLDR